MRPKLRITCPWCGDRPTTQDILRHLNITCRGHRHAARQPRITKLFADTLRVNLVCGCGKAFRDVGAWRHHTGENGRNCTYITEESLYLDSGSPQGRTFNAMVAELRTLLNGKLQSNHVVKPPPSAPSAPKDQGGGFKHGRMSRALPDVLNIIQLGVSCPWCTTRLTGKDFLKHLNSCAALGAEPGMPRFTRAFADLIGAVVVCGCGKAFRYMSWWNHHRSHIGANCPFSEEPAPYLSSDSKQGRMLHNMLTQVGMSGNPASEPQRQPEGRPAETSSDAMQGSMPTGSLPESNTTSDDRCRPEHPRHGAVSNGDQAERPSLQPQHVQHSDSHPTSGSRTSGQLPKPPSDEQESSVCAPNNPMDISQIVCVRHKSLGHSSEQPAQPVEQLPVQQPAQPVEQPPVQQPAQDPVQQSALPVEYGHVPSPADSNAIALITDMCHKAGFRWEDDIWMLYRLALGRPHSFDTLHPALERPLLDTLDRILPEVTRANSAIATMAVLLLPKMGLSEQSDPHLVHCLKEYPVPHFRDLIKYADSLGGPAGVRRRVTLDVREHTERGSTRVPSETNKYIKLQPREGAQAANLQFLEEIHALGQGERNNSSLPQSEAELLRETARQMHEFAGTGPSGWSVSMLRVALQSDRMTEYLVLLMEGMRRGEAGGRFLLCASRQATMRQGDDIRTVAVCETFYCLIMKAVLRTMGKQVGAGLLPLQFGLGSRCGKEPIVQAIDQVYRGGLQHYAQVTVLRFSDAYNTLRREDIIKGIRRHYGGSFNLVRWAYDWAVPQLSVEDEEQPTEGVREGDPLAPLLVTVGMRELLERLEDALGPDHLFLAYMDLVLVLSARRAEVIKCARLAVRSAGMKVSRESKEYGREELNELVERVHSDPGWG